MYKRTIVSLLALLFAVPLYATSAQEQVNAEVLSYLRQGKIKALATYLGSLKECPDLYSSGYKIKEKNFPAICVRHKFNRKGQNGEGYKNFKNFERTVDGPIEVEVESAKAPGFFKKSTLNAVSISQALYHGLTQVYRERFKTEPGKFNKSNYVKFYNTYKNTWLKNDVMDLITWGWIIQKRYFYPEGTVASDENDAGTAAYKSTVLAQALNMKVGDMLAPFFEEYSENSIRWFVKEVWSAAIKNGNKGPFYAFKTAFRDYCFSEKRFDDYVYLNSSGVRSDLAPAFIASVQADRIYLLRYQWESVMIAPIPEDMKKFITRVIHRCYNIVNDPSLQTNLPHWSRDSQHFSKETCDGLKELAKNAGVYRNSAAKAKAKTKAAVKAKKKAGTKMKTPIPLSQHHPR